MTRRFMLGVLCGGIAMLSASGCGRATAPAPTAEATAAVKPRIALVMKSLANEFFTTMENGAREHQKQHADQYELVAQGIKDEQDVARQVQIIEQMIAQKVSAIVISPADSKALVPVCKRAVEAGIVVVNIDNKFDDAVLQEQGITFPFVGPNNRKAAAEVAAYVATKLQAGDPVAILEGAPNAYNAIQRKLGFDDAIATAGLKVVASQTGYWETDKANQVASAMISEHPEIKALICANDSMALGAVAALRAAGKLSGVLVSGFDNISAVQDLLKAKEVIVTADQHADKVAAYGIEFVLEILAGRAAPADRETPIDIIKAE